MVRGKFAGLGFDPAPGNAGDVLAAAEALTGAGTRLAGAPGSARAVFAPASWQGAAADGFATAGAPVPGALDAARGDLRAAGQALHTWHDRLTTNQRAAERLDATARRLRENIRAAERDVLAADARLAAATGPSRAHAAEVLRAAQQHLSALRTRLTTTIRAAQRLARRHRREADTTAAALRGTPQAGAWPDTAVSGVATDASGTSAWTGQLATITLPGATDPVVALPIGTQPGDADWPVLPDGTQVPVDALPGDVPVGPDGTELPVPVDPADVPDVTDPAATGLDPRTPIRGAADAPTDVPQPRPGTDGTRPAAAVLATPVTRPPATTATVSRRSPTHHQEPAAARVVTTPTHSVRVSLHQSTTSDSHRVEPGPGPNATEQPKPLPHDAPAPVPDRPTTPVVAQPSAAPAELAPPATDPATGTTSTVAETVAPPVDTGTDRAPNPAGPTPTPAHESGHHAPQSATPSQPQQPAQQVTAAPTHQVAPAQPTSGNTPNSQQGAEHRKADALPLAPLPGDALPSSYTDVVVPAPPKWDGTSVAPLRTAGLLPDVGTELMTTFVITAALGPALIAESLAGSRSRVRTGDRKRAKGKRLRAFLLQPGGEQVVVLTMQGRGADGWTTRRALFLRAVAQYRRPAGSCPE